MNRTLRIFILVSAILVAGLLDSENANAVLKLDSIQFDPPIIASGDEVDIVVQFHQEAVAEEKRIGNREYQYHVALMPDDTLTKKYVIIEDAEGDDLHGAIFAGGYYNKRFRVKVKTNAPAGSYEFKIKGQWYRNGVPEEEHYEYIRFRMPVKREGIIIDIANIQTVPAEVRPGDDYVRIDARIENTGEKDAKAVEVNLKLPEGIESSYTNNNRRWVGRVNSGESKLATFFVDVDDELEPGVYYMQAEFEYRDIDNNKYEKKIRFPFLVKPTPHIVVTESRGSGLAGGHAKLYVKVKNTGTEAAESVDVRVIKQNSQPFTLDVRSDYVGELEPGEEGLAVFNLKINRDAEIKKYDIKLIIRSKGDSDEGDDNIYTYERRTKFEVTGKAENNLRKYGLWGAAAVVVLIVVSRVLKRKKRK